MRYIPGAFWLYQEENRQRHRTFRPNRMKRDANTAATTVQISKSNRTWTWTESRGALLGPFEVAVHKLIAEESARKFEQRLWRKLLLFHMCCFIDRCIDSHALKSLLSSQIVRAKLAKKFGMVIFGFSTSSAFHFALGFLQLEHPLPVIPMHRLSPLDITLYE